MAERYRDMSLRQFQARFRTEAICREYLFKVRWPNGFVCPSCENRGYYYLPNRDLFQCKACSHQASVTAGTVMRRTRTALRIWFWAIYLMANDKRGLSALQLSKKLGVSYYVAWTMLHKIRKAMKDGDGLCELKGLVQAERSVSGKGAGGDKRGRGAKVTKVSVAIGVNGDTLGAIRMDVIDSAGAASPQVAQKGQSDRSAISERGQESSVLDRWSSIIASNAKSFLLGTFHGIGRKHLQKYLDEFCYRFNRRLRESQLFNLLMTPLAQLMCYDLTYPVEE